MTSKLKALGLALLAIAAMSMVGASAAQAGLGELHAETGPNADITGEQSEVQQVFTLTGPQGVTKCTQANLEGTVPGQVSGQTTATELTLTATYTGCTGSIAGISLGTVTVDMNGCKYTITGGVAELTANVDIAGCTTGKHIEITTSIGCTITVPEQGPLSHITFTNIAGPPKDVKAHITVQGITYQFDGIACPDQNTHSDGDYTGTATIKAFVDQGSTTLATHNGHQYNKLVCGSQVGLFGT